VRRIRRIIHARHPKDEAEQLCGEIIENGSRAGVVLGDLADHAAPKVRVNAMAPGPTLPSCLQSAEDCARRVHAV
jgi:hypothetical protein